MSTSEQARGIITRQLENMTRLVNDLVDGARITQGTMDVRLATDLTAVLHQALEVWRRRWRSATNTSPSSVPTAPGLCSATRPGSSRRSATS